MINHTCVIACLDDDDGKVMISHTCVTVYLYDDDDDDERMVKQKRLFFILHLTRP